jgi:hypothetical protein
MILTGKKTKVVCPVAFSLLQILHGLAKIEPSSECAYLHAQDRGDWG